MAKEQTSYSRTEIEHHRDENGKVTGHTVKHFPIPKATKSGAFMERPEPPTAVFGAHDGKAMMAHLQKHLGVGAAPSPKTEEGEMVADKHEPPAAEIEEDAEGV
jgi:hypothetical protein